MIAERGAEFLVKSHQLLKNSPGQGPLGNRFTQDSQNSEDVSGNYASHEGPDHQGDGHHE